MLLAHNTGFVEIWYGEVEGAEDRARHRRRRPHRDGQGVPAGQRLYGLVEGDLLWAYDMAAMGQALQPHLWARLEPVSEGQDTT